MPPLPADYRGVMAAHSASFSFASRLFPARVRQDAYVLYAFLRACDDIADRPGAKIEELREIEARFFRAYERPDGGDSLATLTAGIFRRKAIPLACMRDFFETLAGDIARTSILTRDDFDRYAYGVGGTVGIMMAHLIGFIDPHALAHARTLGEAMQATNILRDIAEDWDLFKRVYLPADDLARFGVTKDDLARKHLVPGLQKLIIEFTARARAQFAQGREGIRLLAGGRRAVLLASFVYEAILDEIAKQDYNPFAGRARVSSWKKLRLLAAALAA